MELLNDKTRIPTWFHKTPSLTPFTISWHHFGKKKKLDPQNYCYFSYYDWVASTLK